MEGYGNGTFKPEAAITREQLAAILYRYDGEHIGKRKPIAIKKDAAASFFYTDNIISPVFP